jgi:hypothetical protein
MCRPPSTGDADLIDTRNVSIKAPCGRAAVLGVGRDRARTGFEDADVSMLLTSPTRASRSGQLGDRICLVDTHDDPIEGNRVFCGRTMTCFDAGAQALMRPVDDWGADWRLASSSATNSFFDNLPTGVFGNEGRISISVGIS